MTRPKPEEIEEQLKKQELDTDGSEGVGGSASVAGDGSTADVDEMMEQVIGNEPKDDDNGFNIASEVNKDEKDIFEKPIDDYEDEEEEGELEKAEKKENVTEDAASDDPYETLGEDDDTDEPQDEE